MSITHAAEKSIVVRAVQRRRYTDTDGRTVRRTVRFSGPILSSDLQTMKEGDISDPIRVGDQVVIVFKLANRERIPRFEEVKDQMEDQATEEAILHQRALWIQELRRTIYLDIKL